MYKEYHPGFSLALNPGDQALTRDASRKCCLKTGWSAESMKNIHRTSAGVIAILSDQCATATRRRFDGGLRQYDSKPQHDLP
jgi:hypothetical protein